MNARILSTLILCSSAGLVLTGCSKSDDGSHGSQGSHDHGSHTHDDGTVHGSHDEPQTTDTNDHGTHTHDDGTTHGSHGDTNSGSSMNHDEVPLPPVVSNGMTYTFFQGHGSVKAGQESHLVVKLPNSEQGSTIVRAWIGTDDRTLSFVGMGEYSASGDRYDIHAMAPSPLPENTMWWIEIETSNGDKTLISTTPIR